MPRFGHAVLGGTFDRLHVGHAALLATAFRLGRRVSIGLTTEAFLEDHPKPGRYRIRSYAARRAALRRWLASRYDPTRWRIVPLHDRFGRSTDPGVGLLVVSAETEGGGHAVNAERRRLGRRPVPVAIVPLVLADDLAPVSSRRIRDGEIDRHGRRRAPLRVGVGAPDRAAARAVARAARGALRRARVRAVVEPDRPGASRVTAEARARRALAGAELAVGVARRRNGWVIVERSATVALTPRAVRGADLEQLAEGVARMLRPAPPQPL